MKRPDPTPAEHATEVVRLLADSRTVDAYRVNELTPPEGPFSRSWLYARLREKQLVALRIGDVTLITGPSLRALIAGAQAWVPR